MVFEIKKNPITFKEARSREWKSCIGELVILFNPILNAMSKIGKTQPYYNGQVEYDIVVQYKKDRHMHQMEINFRTGEFAINKEGVRKTGVLQGNVTIYRLDKVGMNRLYHKCPVVEYSNYAPKW